MQTWSDFIREWLPVVGGVFATSYVAWRMFRPLLQPLANHALDRLCRWRMRHRLQQTQRQHHEVVRRRLAMQQRQQLAEIHQHLFRQNQPPMRPLRRVAARQNLRQDQHLIHRPGSQQPRPLARHRQNRNYTAIDMSDNADVDDESGVDDDDVDESELDIDEDDSGFIEDVIFFFRVAF